MIEKAVAHYASLYNANQSNLLGAATPWFKQLRQSALLQLQAQGLPTIRHEDWKYTALDPILRREFALAPLSAQSNQWQYPAWLATEKQVLVFIDGAFSAQFSKIQSLPKGVSLQPMSVALQQHADLIRAHINQCIQTKGPDFTALNTALLQDGMFLHIAPNTIVKEPIFLIFYNTVAATPITIAWRNLIIAEANSQVKIVEHFSSADEAENFTNSISEIILQDSAEVEHIKLQQEGQKAYHIGSIHVNQTKDSKFTSHAINLGARLSRNDINIRLQAENAACTLYGLYLERGRQHHDTHTRIDHLVPNCKSFEEYKGILDGFARAVFNGKVIVHKDAQGTDAEQINQNLLLSNDAEIDTKPQLEIFADDVKCSHGATVGQLDNNALFYLRARGICESTARDILTYGFAKGIIDRMPLPNVKQQLEQTLLTQLPSGGRIKEFLS